MVTNPVAKNVSNVNKEAVQPRATRITMACPFLSALATQTLPHMALACASGLVAHDLALERSKALTADATGAPRTSKRGARGVAHISWARQFSHVTASRHSGSASF